MLIKELAGLNSAAGIARFCAQECERQGTGPIAVADMFDAYQKTLVLWELNKSFSFVGYGFICDLARTVDPTTNQDFVIRDTPVFFRNGGTAMPVNLIPAALERLVEAVKYPELGADEFYHSFEHIHPFRDGNGRVGAILWNLLNNTIWEPQTPPEYASTGGYVPIGAEQPDS